jgi:hypothetical protein
MDLDQSDVLTDKEKYEFTKQEQELTKDLMSRVQGKEEATRFLHSELGMQMRKFIANGKDRAMKEATTGHEDEIHRARSDFQVWSKLESIFGEIIVNGQQAESQLQSILESEVTYENENE